MKDWGVDNSWTLFLDRDGVINERILGGYVQSISEFKFLPGVLESLATLSSYFQYIFVVTNQQGIGKKLMTTCNLSEIHAYMLEKVKLEGGRIDEVFFAPELKTDPLHTRKPKPDMANQAKEKYPSIDFNKSIMVGDTDSDILFGRNLGMKTIRIIGADPIQVEADITLSGLNELRIIN
jgi:D-glycero-D-manno-heptose 1,7-bisphosphate phosphatase